MKVLNLYAGIGGNRKKWPESVKVTAVEHSEEIAAIYRDHFPNDIVTVGDAHEYLLQHHKEYDFIWSSPPCQSHSVSNLFLNAQGVIRYPDMKLWQEIIFLQQFATGKWVVENVQPYYEPIIKPSVELGRHFFWSNFKIKPTAFETLPGNINRTIREDSTHFGFNIAKYKIKRSQRKDGVRADQILRNMVDPDLGLYIFEQAQGITRNEKIEQLGLFGESAA